jgi:hypothetical protein
MSALGFGDRSALNCDNSLFVFFVTFVVPLLQTAGHDEYWTAG